MQRGGLRQRSTDAEEDRIRAHMTKRPGTNDGDRVARFNSDHLGPPRCMLGVKQSAR